MSDRIEVGPVETLRPGERRIVDTGGVSIGVFNVDGEYYALLNSCSHEGGPVCEGKQQPALTGEYVGAGERVKEEFDPDTPVIACPWHGWEYDLKTGEHAGDPEESLPTFDVVVDGGTVYVEL